MRNFFLKAVIYGWCNILFFPYHTNAQAPVADTLKLTISQAEEIFLQKNLALLANHYNININKALVEQAKVWDNPVLNTDQNLYDGKFFRHTKVGDQYYGQVYVQVQQLIKTAGKIKKQTQLAQDMVLSSEAQFNDLMRNLKFSLATNMNNLAQLQHTASVYQNEMQTMKTLVSGMDEMFKIGDISQKENIRIKALMFSLQNDYNENIQQQTDIQKELAELLQFTDNIWLVAEASQLLPAQQINSLIYKELQDSALQLRPDLSVAKIQSIYEQHNIEYQKALAKPDITLGLEYDQNSSYARNIFGLGISLPIPVFNKNKGNIAAAKFTYKQSELTAQQLKTQVNNEVLNVYRKLLNATTLLNNDNSQLHDDYEKMMKNMTESYKQRHIGLVEFIDFFDAYKDTRTKQLQQVNNQRNAAAELNYTVNQNIIKL